MSRTRDGSIHCSQENPHLVCRSPKPLGVWRSQKSYGCSSGLVCNENGDKRRASKYLRRVLERFFGASISLPTKTSWCQATVVALAMQITGDDASRELGRAVARL